MLIGIDIRINKYSYTNDGSSVVGNEIITISISNNNDSNNNNNMNGLDNIIFNYNNSSDDDGNDIGGTFCFIDEKFYNDFNDIIINKDNLIMKVKASSSSSSSSSCYTGTSSLFRIKKYNDDNNNMFDTNSYSHSLFKTLGSTMLTLELISSSSSSSSSIHANRRITLTLTIYKISCNPNMMKPVYKPIIHINKFDGIINDNTYTYDDFHENENKYSYSSSVLEDSLNVTDFLNNFNITDNNCHYHNSNNDGDDDDDDKLLNEIIQRMEEKENQRLLAKISVLNNSNDSNNNDNNSNDNNNSNKEIDINHDDRSRRGVTFDDDDNDNYKTVANTNLNIPFNHPNTNTKTYSKNPKNKKKVSKVSDRACNGKGIGFPRYASLMSKVDFLLDKKSHTLIANTFTPDIDEQLVTNPNINRPNEVNYLFRLPIKPKEPEPLFIVKK